MVFDKKAYMKAYNQLPEVKAKKKAKMKAYNQLPEVKAKKKAKMKAYNQLPEVKAKKKAYMKAYHQHYTPNYKKKAKISEKNIKEILMKHNLSHLAKAMILDGISLDRELKNHKIKVNP